MRKRLCLILDDEPDACALVDTVVREYADCTTAVFHDPLDALDWSASHAPDLVIVDYHLEQMNGVEFLERFRQREALLEVPAIMVTGETQRSLLAEALSTCVQDFLIKPLDVQELAARVKNLLDLGHQRRQMQNQTVFLEDLVSQRLKSIRELEMELIRRISRAVQLRSPHTTGHLYRVAYYANLIARGLNLSDDDQDLLLEAAPLHDVGKISTPDGILSKGAALTAEEAEILKRHAMDGYELLKGSNSEIARAGAIIALTHHERFDGLGYPQGLKGEDIPLFGRIVGLANHFDGLTFSEKGRPAMSLTAARAFIEESAGSLFDPACVAAFIAHWESAIIIQQHLHTITLDH
jgi:response regulator RpfG family c-di-GMP phosphodiesterase